MRSSATPTRSTVRRHAAARLALMPGVAAIVAAGVWVAGGVVSDDFRTSIGLTTLWLGVSGAACVLVAVRRPALRVPVLAAYAVTAAALGAYLGFSTLHDRVVDERVVTAAAPRASAGGAAAPDGNVELARGRFRSHEHATAGTASVVRLPGGRRFLTLTRFATSPGPDLRVRLVPGDSADGGVGGALDLGGLKGNRGDQQYELPRTARVAGSTVVVWCRAFSAAFGSAALRAA